MSGVNKNLFMTGSMKPGNVEYDIGNEITKMNRGSRKGTSNQNL